MFTFRLIVSDNMMAGDFQFVYRYIKIRMQYFLTKWSFYCIFIVKNFWSTEGMKIIYVYNGCQKCRPSVSECLHKTCCCQTIIRPFFKLDRNISSVYFELMRKYLIWIKISVEITFINFLSNFSYKLSEVSNYSIPYVNANFLCFDAKLF